MSASPSDLNLLLQSRVDFFRRWRSDRIINTFLANESRLITLVSAESRPISIGILPAFQSLQNFFDPILVAATQQQIDSAFLIPATQPEGSCPICQETYNGTEATIRLRNCSHCFHRECAQSWYRMSVYCPVCRNDIRTSPTS